MILAQVWEAIFAQTSTGHSIFSRAFQAQILLGCEASVPQLSKLVHNLHIHAKMGALRTKFKVKIYHGDWDQIFHTFKKWTFWHPLTQKLVKMVMPQYIEGGFMLFSKIHDSHSTTSDQISWLHSLGLRIEIDEITPHFHVSNYPLILESKSEILQTQYSPTFHYFR